MSAHDSHAAPAAAAPVAPAAHVPLLDGKEFLANWTAEVVESKIQHAIAKTATLNQNAIAILKFIPKPLRSFWAVHGVTGLTTGLLINAAIRWGLPKEIAQPLKLLMEGTLGGLGAGIVNLSEEEWGKRVDGAAHVLSDAPPIPKEADIHRVVISPRLGRIFHLAPVSGGKYVMHPVHHDVPEFGCELSSQDIAIFELTEGKDGTRTEKGEKGKPPRTVKAPGNPYPARLCDLDTAIDMKYKPCPACYGFDGFKMPDAPKKPDDGHAAHDGHDAQAEKAKARAEYDGKLSPEAQNFLDAVEVAIAAHSDKSQAKEADSWYNDVTTLSPSVVERLAKKYPLKDHALEWIAVQALVAKIRVFAAGKQTPKELVDIASGHIQDIASGVHKPGWLTAILCGLFAGVAVFIGCLALMKLGILPEDLIPFYLGGSVLVTFFVLGLVKRPVMGALVVSVTMASLYTSAAAVAIGTFLHAWFTPRMDMGWEGAARVSASAVTIIVLVLMWGPALAVIRAFGTKLKFLDEMSDWFGRRGRQIMVIVAIVAIEVSAAHVTGAPAWTRMILPVIMLGHIVWRFQMINTYRVTWMQKHDRVSAVVVATFMTGCTVIIALVISGFLKVDFSKDGFGKYSGPFATWIKGLAGPDLSAYPWMTLLIGVILTVAVLAVAMRTLSAIEGGGKFVSAMVGLVGTVALFFGVYQNWPPSPSAPVQNVAQVYAEKRAVPPVETAEQRLIRSRCGPDGLHPKDPLRKSYHKEFPELCP